MTILKNIGGKHMRRMFLLLLAVVAGFSLAPRANAQVGGDPWVGEILAVPYNFAPNGWALCQGQILSISQNTALFSLLGTTYGGDGKTNFALPDLRGRTPLSSGQGPGLSNYDLGQTGGEESVTLTLNQMPAHNHAAMGTTTTGNTGTPGGTWAMQTRVMVFSSSGNTTMAPLALAPAGGNLPHENRSPFLVLNYVIALQGIYPSRS